MTKRPSEHMKYTVLDDLVCLFFWFSGDSLKNIAMHITRSFYLLYLIEVYIGTEVFPLVKPSSVSVIEFINTIAEIFSVRDHLRGWHDGRYRHLQSADFPLLTLWYTIILLKFRVKCYLSVGQSIFKNRNLLYNQTLNK